MMDAREIENLTEADVVAAKARVIEARKTRAGVGTVDFVLSGVNGTSHTLDEAKAYLLGLLP